ncbi:MAG TPA: hypothetical protein VK612_05275 [Pyrinomonadaceae bacterium]|nr:hypothetical protein [Pyrinomonadaceae bacterium]
MKIFLLSVVTILLMLAANVSAQKAAAKIRVCGDISAACSTRAMFDDDDIPFEYPKGSAVAETAPFYAVIIKSVKLPAEEDCEKVPSDFSRKEFQWNFPKNKVFIARGCYSIQNNSYTNVGDSVIALAIYAGATKAEADRFLRTIRSVSHIDAQKAYIVRMSTGFNGT